MVLLTIGDLTASPGEKISGNIRIGTSNNSNITATATENGTQIPITIINGIGEGPTVLVLSGIHGSEYTPIMATQRLAKDLDPSTLRGALILIHIANLPAYLGRTVYTSPMDGKNLNRVFPGNPNGTLSDQIANFLVQDAYPLADYVLDMHSGDANEQLGPSYTAYYGKAGSTEVIEASKAMAIAFGLELVVEFQWELLGDNKSNAIWAGSAAVVRDIPSIDVELAPGMGTSHSSTYSIDQAYKGVLRVMLHVGILKDNEIPMEDEDNLEAPCLVKNRHFIEAPLAGSWFPLVDTGTFVIQKTSLGYITDFYGRNQIFEAKAPADGLLLIRFETPPVVKGDTLAVVAILNSSNVACQRLKRDGELYMGKEPPSDILIFWQWFAVTGWLVALGIGAFIGIGRIRKSCSRQHAHVSIAIEEVGTMDTGVV